MIDLEFLRQGPESVKKMIQKKDPSFDADALINLDESVRKLRMEVEELRHQKNQLAKTNGNMITDEIKAHSKNLGILLKEKEELLNSVLKKFNDLYLECPNLLNDQVPEGNKEENQLLKSYGTKPVFNFEIKNHVELATINNWIDFEAAAKMTGAQFALYKGQAVKFVYALMLHMFNNNTKYGFFPILPPYLVNEEALIGASNFPRFKDQVYEIKNDNLYLTPTSEVNLTSIYSNHILNFEDLPIRMTSWTSCFRREAGGYGAAERGLIRIHQFEKLELYAICEPDQANVEQERMIACAEDILKSLNLHYRIMLLAAQDTSFASAKTYDIEVWMPAQGVYKEVSSISNCTDFQSRRSKIRYRANNGAKTQLPYTLNGSSLALPRLMVAIMETFQNQYGQIEIPEVLKSVNITV